MSATSAVSSAMSLPAVPIAIPTVAAAQWWRVVESVADHRDVVVSLDEPSHVSRLALRGEAGQGEQPVLVDTVVRAGLGELRPAMGEGAGLVERDGTAG